ncbi:MAG: hypothetical protein ACKVRN_17060 [Pyrinomonadaceae bacterium]
MRRLYRQVFIVLVSLFACQSVDAQTNQAAGGSMTVSGRARIGSKTVVLKKTRFYLFRGSRVANKPLIDKLKAANPTSRDCFYCRLKASPEFVDWLKDCESVHCREITQEDAEKVPEFQAAYQKGMKDFVNKPKFAPIFALQWLVTNLEPGLRSGFYDMRKALEKDLEKDIVQTAMTDNSAASLGYFTKIPMGVADEKFVYTNLVPFETGGKSYVWVCDADIGKKTPIMETPEAGKDGKKCDAIIRDLPDCKAGKCDQK